MKLQDSSYKFLTFYRQILIDLLRLAIANRTLISDQIYGMLASHFPELEDKKITEF